MNLLVDIGNTRVKWACADNKTLFDHDGFSYTQDTLPEQLVRKWSTLVQPKHVYIASVVDAETTAKVREYIRANWSLEPQQAVAEKERAGLTNAYDDVTAMGVDRWLAMLAAWNRYNKPVCVIDCGTALTVDIILADGRHAGGFILPGMPLMSSALIRETHGIQEHHETAVQLEFGRSTAACIRNGFAFALAGLVERCARKIREEQGAELLFIVTGGGAEQALPMLPGQYCHEPHLVLEGLNLISH